MKKPPYGYMKTLRHVFQAGLLALVIWLGWRMWLFTQYYLTHGRTPRIPHPSGVEGFLPIGALTSLKYLLFTGDLHPVHPAATFMFIGALGVSVVLKKGFCGWICPVNFISERISWPWRRLLKKNLQPPKWLDWPLRSLKYLLLGFFFWIIVINMPIPGIKGFLDTPYWKVADVKMLEFFTDISPLALGIILALVVLSVPISNFWCRYLCPYGALTGLVGMLSPFRITRIEDKCIDCGKCTKNCPQYLPVDKKARIISPECTSCLTCLSCCPTAAIEYSTPGRKFSLPAWSYPVLLVAIFFGLILYAKLTGHWHAGVTDAQYMKLIPVADKLVHP